MSEAQSAAQASLSTLEQRFLQFDPIEQSEIEVLRMWLREAIVQHDCKYETCNHCCRI